MKVLHLSTYDTLGGAARAAFRLHTILRTVGVESQMLVQVKHSNDASIICSGSKIKQNLVKSRPYIDRFLTKFLYNKRPRFPFSPAVVPDNLPSKIREIDPDIVHLHWLNDGFVQIETLKHINKPIVWTLHDSWAFTGGCHIPFECLRYRQSCGACPTLASSKDYDISRWVWKRKTSAWTGLNLIVVTPSQWLASCAQSSSLFRNTRVQVIPNGLDVGLFKPENKLEARKFFGLPADKQLILFGAYNATSDKNKGFHLLLPALQKLARLGWSNKAELAIVGATKPANPPDFGIKAHYLGIFKDDSSLARLYAAADVFVAPSLQENLSNAVMEALACGTPCVAFEIGGMPDMIDHHRNGYLARPFEVEDLFKGITTVLQDRERWQKMSECASEKAQQNFRQEIQAQNYISIYQQHISNNG